VRPAAGALRVSVAALAAGLVMALPAAPAPAAMRPGIWITPAELRALPERGPAWAQLVALSRENLGRASLSDQDSDHDVRVLATALVAARTDDDRLRQRAAAGIMDAIGTEHGGRTLALARGLQSYVIAADLIGLRRLDPGKDRVFRAWLRQVPREKLQPSDNPTLILTHELRPNNWGTHAGASRIAVDIYLGDARDLRRAAAVFKGWLGDRTAYHGFVWGDRSWQADPRHPVGVDPAGAHRDGIDVDGALPDDMRRGCDLKNPPCPTRYPWEAMQGATAQAEMLYRQGYDSYRWGDDALKRAATYLFALARRTGQQDWAAPSGHGWVPWLLNARYGIHLPTRLPTPPGKGIGFTDWTAAAQRGDGANGAGVAVAPARAADPPASRVERTARDALPIVLGAIAAASVALVAAIVIGRRRRPARRRPARG